VEVATGVVLAAGTGRKNSRLPTEKDPLSGIKLSAIPQMFRLRVGWTMRKWLKAKTAYNQQGKMTSSFPWPSTKHSWPLPEFATTQISFVNFLLHYFCRIYVNMPDMCMSKFLPNGRMPCK
jgi:hypothetical protein